MKTTRVGAPHLLLLAGGCWLTACACDSGSTPNKKAEAPAAAPTAAKPSGKLAAPSSGKMPTPSKVVAGFAWGFEDGAAGALPTKWSAAKGTWKVAAVKGAAEGKQVLVQSAKSRGPIFNIALASESSFTDVELSVRFRALSGKIDQGGGLVWRAQDARNYYVARHNPLEDNYRVYKVVNGRRKQLGSANASVKAGEWHTLKVTMVGDHIKCSLNGKKELDVHDSTFAAAGKIGLWTKADAHTEFDALKAASASPSK